MLQSKFAMPNIFMGRLDKDETTYELSRLNSLIRWVWNCERPPLGAHTRHYGGAWLKTYDITPTRKVTGKYTSKHVILFPEVSWDTLSLRDVISHPLATAYTMGEIIRSFNTFNGDKARGLVGFCRKFRVMLGEIDNYGPLLKPASRSWNTKLHFPFGYYTQEDAAAMLHGFIDYSLAHTPSIDLEDCNAAHEWINAISKPLLPPQWPTCRLILRTRATKALRNKGSQGILDKFWRRINVFSTLKYAKLEKKIKGRWVEVLIQT